MSFPCSNCRTTVSVQMCDDGSFVSVSGLQAPPSPASDFEVPERFANQHPLPTAQVASHSERQRQDLPPLLPDPGRNPLESTVQPSIPPVAGHVPFASLEDTAPKRRANTGWPFLDSLINEPPTPTQIVLGIVLLVAAVFVFTFDPRSTSTSSDQPEATPPPEASRPDIGPTEQEAGSSLPENQPQEPVLDTSADNSASADTPVSADD